MRAVAVVARGHDLQPGPQLRGAMHRLVPAGGRDAARRVLRRGVAPFDHPRVRVTTCAYPIHVEGVGRRPAVLQAVHGVRRVTGHAAGSELLAGPRGRVEREQVLGVDFRVALAA